MPLDIDETTPITEAIENGTRALVAVTQDVSQRAERLVSDATRDSGNAATMADYVVNASNLYLSMWKGATTLAATALDNLVLVTANVPRFWTSSFRTYPIALPTAGSAWRLRVDSATQGADDLLAGGAVHLLDDKGVAIGSTSNPVDVPAGWNRQFRVVLRKFPYTPGLVTWSVSAVRADAPLTVKYGPHSFMASLSVDTERLNQ